MDYKEKYEQRHYGDGSKKYRTPHSFPMLFFHFSNRLSSYGFISITIAYYDNFFIYYSVAAGISVVFGSGISYTE